MTSPAAAPARSSFGVASWRALGTYVQLVVAGDAALEQAQAIAQAVLAGVDRTCSRFRADSDLVRANAAAGTWVRVDPLLVEAVCAALEAARGTGGLVDPTLGADLVAAGYDADLDEVRARTADPSTDHHESADPADPAALPPTPWALQTPRALQTPWTPRTRYAGWADVEVDPDGGLKVPAGVCLDLGATAKAWAADLVADAVAAGTGKQLVVSLGGDVATGLPDPARGEIDADDAVEPIAWQIDIAELPDAPAQERVSLVAAGLATSSTQARRWKHAGRIVHHLIDPRTGGPVQEIYRTVSVVAPTCLQANTASTAALVLGERAPAWLAAAGLGARLVDLTGTVALTRGWPA